MCERLEGSRVVGYLSVNKYDSSWYNPINKSPMDSVRSIRAPTRTLKAQSHQAYMGKPSACRTHLPELPPAVLVAGPCRAQAHLELTLWLVGEELFHR